MSDLSNVPLHGQPGLRDRKKAMRRDEIIAAARDLFARKGIDATTMADIAAASVISPPTVFNYFGSKDGILIALITEGTSAAREGDRDMHWQDATDLTTLIVSLFQRISTRTLDIADKRVWRYAEAAAIRHPETELARQYEQVSAALVGVVTDFFAGLDLHLRSGEACSPTYLGQVFHDIWMPCFIRLITVESQSLCDHEAMLQARVQPLVAALFDASSAQAPRRKGGAV
jgi:AcrR family transcriptional regulator